MAAPHLALWTDSGSLVFLSGQLPFDENRVISAPDIEGQTAQTMRNIAQVLAQAGLTLDQVVKATVWLKDAADFAGFNQAYADAFGNHAPARSTVVSDLILPQALVEIEVVAQRPAQ
ncbi:RidA family protein [Sphingomonas gei]|uniref:RidA family protein n=1 Tax=Sphingomonas gei TaxID=1395960 RepID=A0A4S1X1D2_9SPHN|nr:RidA family protein [Sphingomonas gei]TGX48747.1 RidA family protein [Sphingomonas gei]